MAKYILSDIFEGDYPVTQYYGQRPEYYSQFGLAGHEGVDWGTPTGVKIISPFDGEILRDVDLPGDKSYGDFIVVWDPVQKCAVWYCHLQENYVSLGDKVKKGQILGLTNNTGNSSGPHLHLNFVETDASGNRLNKDNGYQGFLNVLDSNLVEWKFGSDPSPVVSGTTITIPTSERDMLVGKASKYDEFVNAGYDSVEKVKAEIKSKQETIDNCNQQLKDRNNDIVTLNAKISTLDSQLLSLTTERDGLASQVEKLQGADVNNVELEHQKALWVKQEKGYLARIAELQKQLDSVKKNSFSSFVKSILDKLFNKK